jgi:hypothetical protein
MDGKHFLRGPSPHFHHGFPVKLGMTNGCGLVLPLGLKGGLSAICYMLFVALVAHG